MLEVGGWAQDHPAPSWNPGPPPNLSEPLSSHLDNGDIPVSQDYRKNGSGSGVVLDGETHHGFCCIEHCPGPRLAFRIPAGPHVTCTGRATNTHTFL